MLSISSSSGRIATVRAGLELQSREHPAADDAADHLAIAAVLARAFAQRLDLPVLCFRIARIHAQQIASKDRRFVAAGAGADFQVDVARVARVVRQQQLLQLHVACLQQRPQATHFLLAQCPHAGVAVLLHVLGRLQFRFQRAEQTEGFSGRLQT
jgi:hypothetical protein